MPEVIVMPRLTATMQTGKVVKWLKQEGDPVNKGEVILELQADKVVMQLESEHSGVLLKRLCEEGREVPVGQPLAYIGKEGEEIPPETVPAVEKKPEQPEPAEAVSSPSPAEKVKASPVAKRMARENNIDLTKVKGTGRNGLIGKDDVEAYLAAGRSGEPEDFIPLEGAKRVMAERMAMSKRTAAHATTIAEVDMYEAARFKEKEKFAYTSAVVFAAAQALREFPLVNSTLAEDKIILHKEINVCVAVSAGENLLVPVIRNADRHSVVGCDAEIKRLAGLARDGKLTIADMEGGTFTVTNSGVFGSLFFIPIINYPQSAILGMGKVADTPVVRSGGIHIRPVMHLSLSYDHRIIEGEVAVRFLQKVKSILEAGSGTLQA